MVERLKASLPSHLRQKLVDTVHAQADLLILAEQYDPGPAWQCRECGDTQIGRDSPQACPECSSLRFRSLSVKEEMVRMAEGASCGVTVVEGSDFLIAGGGVGCLTRY